MLRIEVQNTIKPREPQNEDEGFSIFYSTSRSYLDITLSMTVDGETFVVGTYEAKLFDELIEEYLKARKFFLREE